MESRRLSMRFDPILHDSKRLKPSPAIVEITSGQSEVQGEGEPKEPDDRSSRSNKVRLRLQRSEKEISTIWESPTDSIRSIIESKNLQPDDYFFNVNGRPVDLDDTPASLQLLDGTVLVMTKVPAILTFLVSPFFSKFEVPVCPTLVMRTHIEEFFRLSKENTDGTQYQFETENTVIPDDSLELPSYYGLEDGGKIFVSKWFKVERPPVVATDALAISTEESRDVKVERLINNLYAQFKNGELDKLTDEQENSLKKERKVLKKNSAGGMAAIQEAVNAIYKPEELICPKTAYEAYLDVRERLAERIRKAQDYDKLQDAKKTLMKELKTIDQNLNKRDSSSTEIVTYQGDKKSKQLQLEKCTFTIQKIDEQVRSKCYDKFAEQMYGSDRGHPIIKLLCQEKGYVFNKEYYKKTFYDAYMKDPSTAHLKKGLPPLDSNGMPPRVAPKDPPKVVEINDDGKDDGNNTGGRILRSQVVKTDTVVNTDTAVVTVDLSTEPVTPPGSPAAANGNASSSKKKTKKTKKKITKKTKKKSSKKEKKTKTTVEISTDAVVADVESDEEDTEDDGDAQAMVEFLETNLNSIVYVLCDQYFFANYLFKNEEDEPEDFDKVLEEYCRQVNEKHSIKDSEAQSDWLNFYETVLFQGKKKELDENRKMMSSKKIYFADIEDVLDHECGDTADGHPDICKFRICQIFRAIDKHAEQDDHTNCWWCRLFGKAKAHSMFENEYKQARERLKERKRKPEVNHEQEEVTIDVVMETIYKGRWFKEFYQRYIFKFIVSKDLMAENDPDQIYQKLFDDTCFPGEILLMDGSEEREDESKWKEWMERNEKEWTEEMWSDYFDDEASGDERLNKFFDHFTNVCKNKKCNFPFCDLFKQLKYHDYNSSGTRGHKESPCVTCLTIENWRRDIEKKCAIVENDFVVARKDIELEDERTKIQRAERDLETKQRDLDMRERELRREKEQLENAARQAQAAQQEEIARLRAALEQANREKEDALKMVEDNNLLGSPVRHALELLSSNSPWMPPPPEADENGDNEDPDPKPGAKRKREDDAGNSGDDDDESSSSKRAREAPKPHITMDVRVGSSLKREACWKCYKQKDVGKLCSLHTADVHYDGKCEHCKDLDLPCISQAEGARIWGELRKRFPESYEKHAKTGNSNTQGWDVINYKDAADKDQDINKYIEYLNDFVEPFTKWIEEKREGVAIRPKINPKQRKAGVRSCMFTGYRTWCEMTDEDRLALQIAVENGGNVLMSDALKAKVEEYQQEWLNTKRKEPAKKKVGKKKVVEPDQLI